ncbi:MAG: ATP-binding protein [Planctomycetaceae bacterium]
MVAGRGPGHARFTGTWKSVRNRANSTITLDTAIGGGTENARLADRRVTIRCDVSRNCVTYEIRDEGRGFDVRNLPDPRDPDRIGLSSGRGVLMMRAFMDEVTYNDRGNAVTMVKYRAVQPAIGAKAEILHDAIAG